MIAFALGFLFGFAGAMPVAGPISAMVVKRIIDGRLRAARSLGAGASIADGGYAYLAFWGVTGLLKRYPVVHVASQAVAAAILLVLGVHFIRRGSSATTLSPPAPAAERGIKRSFLLGLTINATNPTLLATWTAAVVFVNGSGLVKLSHGHAPIFGIGACLGMASWFVILVAAVRRFSVRLHPGQATLAIRVTGAVLVCVGLGFAYRFASALA